jgi:diguanylate cyclase (GGDEF)-like protein/PAS domain S-box-containing protein
VQLQRLNEQLEQRVTKRTAALMQANEHLQAEISERKQAEEAYTTLVEHSLQALQIFQYGRIVFTNAAATHLTGYSQEEILAFSPEAWPLLIHPDDRAELVQRSRDRLAGKPVSPRYECRFIHKDGTIRWIELLAAPITYQGRPATHMAYIDITERKAAEEAYRILVDNSLQGLSIHQDGRNVFANPAAAHIMGYTQDELLAMTPAESAAAIHPDDRSMLVQRGKDRQAGKPIPQRYSFRIIRKDGCVRWLEAFAVQTFYQGRPAAQMAYIDITERKQAEEALRESEERFTTFMTYLPGPAFIHDENGRVVFANRTYCQHLNRPPEQVIGQPFSVQVSPELAAYFQAQDQQVLATQDACIFEDHAEIDGQLQVFLTTKFPVQQADGSIHIGGVAIDITERKQAEEALRESERFIQQMTTTIPGILYVYDLILKRNIYSNRQMTDILGYTPEDVQAMGQDVMPTLLHPDDLPRAIEHLTVQTQAAEGTVLTFEYRMRSRDGNWRWLLSREVVFKHTADGQPQQILGIAQDITERKQAEESLRESEQRLKAIFDNAAVGIGLTDNAGRSIIANARGAQQLGYTLEELAQRSNLELTHPDDRAETVERMQRLVRGEIQGYRIEKRYFRKDGSIFWADLSVSAVYDDNGQIAYLLGIVVDITERKQLEHQLHQANMLLQEQAIRDPLTGLYNRRYLDETLPRELQRATRQGQPVGVIMLDIDHFKRVNDTYGHNVGDTLLRAVGAFLQHNTRGEDIACRYGGEEFTLVLPGASPEDACQRAEDLRVGIQALAVAHQGQTLDMVTASLGVAIFRMHGTTADALVSAADEALYQAKHSGRNRVVMADNTRAC